MKALVIALIVVGVFVAMPLFFTVILTSGSAQANCSTSSGSRCTVSSDPKVLAMALVAAYDRGTLRDSRPAMITDEIVPMAAGTASAQCSIDVRVLQVLVLTLDHFHSVGISDLERPCVGLSTDCPGSAHCASPDSAVDFTSVAGESVNGYSDADAELLHFLDSIVPPGTAAGQSQCRAQHYQPAIRLAHISRFPDACTHQHVDFQAASGPLSVGR